MPTPILLYSTNTWLAYIINEKYYGGKHYVWCTSFRGPGSLPVHDSTVPPSSSPLEIYSSLSEEVRRGDDHGAKIKQNKVGLLSGASRKREAGTIDAATEREVIEIVDRARITDFRPLLYVIPYGLVRKRVRRVPVESRASPLSEEYIIESLPRRHFELLEFPV